MSSTTARYYKIQFKWALPDWADFSNMKYTSRERAHKDMIRVAEDSEAEWRIVFVTETEVEKL